MAKKSFIGSAVILMIASFIVKIIGFIYRIYLSNLIGAEGMGLFQLISPVYSLIILTLTSGVSIAVSKMVAEEMAKGHHVNLRRITGCALVIVLLAGLAVSLLILIFINPIVNVILKDSRTYYSMLLLIPCIPVIAAASALKGYFYGIQDVVPTACSQVVEQLVKTFLVMAMAGYFVNVGLEYACALATVGMALGEISNLLVLVVVYKFKKKRACANASKKGFMRKRVIVKEIVKISIPVSFNRIIEYVYDRNGRVVQEKRSPEYVTKTEYPKKWNIINYKYDPNGNLAEVTDSLGAVITYEYDCFGKRTLERMKINDRKQRVTRYEYNGVGKLTRVIRELDGEDLSGYSEDKVLAETIYNYDPNGNLIEVISPEGYLTVFKYDDANRRIKSILYQPQNGVKLSGSAYCALLNTKSRSISYEYDRAGTL